MRRAIAKSRSLQARLGAVARRLRADERGVAFVITALAATVLIGFAGLAIDVAMWQVHQRDMQGAADQAAIGAAQAWLNQPNTPALGDPSSPAIPAAYATAIQAGYSVTSGCSSPPCITVAGTSTPTASCSGNKCVLVTITQQQPRYFTGIFLNNPVAATVSAVGGCNGPCGSTSSGTPCAMALDPSGSGVFTASGTPTMSLNACDLYNNSPSTNATVLNGAEVVEGCSLTNSCGSQAYLAQPNNPSGTFDIPENTSSSPAPDPYATATAPTVGSCTAWPSPPINIGSGTYCNIGNITPANAPNGVSFASGAVVVIKGGLTIRGTQQNVISLTGTNVMLYVLGGASINANSAVNITAPTTALYTGAPVGVALWFGDSSQVTWNGGNTTTFSGAIYAPTANVDFSGNSTVFPTTGSICSRVIAGSITLGGSAVVNLGSSGCPPIQGARLAGQPGAALLVQ